MHDQPSTQPRHKLFTHRVAVTVEAENRTRPVTCCGELGVDLSVIRRFEAEAMEHPDILNAQSSGREERAGHDDVLNLVGALVDLGDLGVAHHPLDREVTGVSGAAQQLDR
jgi:hypothetical protein